MQRQIYNRPNASTNRAAAAAQIGPRISLVHGQVLHSWNDMHVHNGYYGERKC